MEPTNLARMGFCPAREATHQSALLREANVLTPTPMTLDEIYGRHS